MAKYGILKNAKILLGGNDLSGFSNEVGCVVKRAMKDATVFTSPNGFDESVPAGFSSEFKVNGFWDYAADPDAVLWERQQSELESSLLITPGEVAAGNLAYFSKIHAASYGFLGGKDDLAPFALGAKGNSAGVRGIILANQAFTETGESDPVQYLGVLAGNRLYLSLHCTDFDATSAQFVLQSSTDEEGSYTDRITLPALSGTGYLWAILDPPLANTWYRLALSTLTGTSVTVTVGIGIQAQT